jgi:hypothetical protein
MSVFTKKNKPVNNNGAEQLPKKSDIGAKPERPKTAGGRKKILLVVGLILLVLAVGGGVYVWQRPTKPLRTAILPSLQRDRLRVVRLRPCPSRPPGLIMRSQRLLRRKRPYAND